jgi:hypothetical protein
MPLRALPDSSKFANAHTAFKIAHQHSSLASTVIDRRYKAFHSTFNIAQPVFLFHSKFKIQHSKLRGSAPHRPPLQGISFNI